MGREVDLVLWLTNPEQLGTRHEYFSVTEPDMDMTLEGWARLRDVKTVLPEKEDVAASVIERLREQQRRVRVRAEETVAEIEQQLQRFLALEGPSGDVL